MSEAEKHKLLRIVNGALKDAINAHGPITPDNIGHASNRIVKQVLGVFK